MSERVHLVKQLAALTLSPVWSQSTGGEELGAVAPSPYIKGKACEGRWQSQGQDGEQTSLCQLLASRVTYMCSSESLSPNFSSQEA